MLVSFIIVAYNAEKYVKDSLNSLLKQDYKLKNIEVILVDSISTDSTKKVMKDFKKSNEKKFNRILVLTNKKKILPCGWNVALKEVKGEAIIRVDAHTTFNSDFISNNVKELEQGENIVGGQCESICLDNSKKSRLLLISEESIFGAGIADFRRKKEREYVSTLAFAMYRKKVFDEVGKYNENLARTEDNEMHYRMRKKGYKFLLSPNIKSFRYARNNFKGMIKQKYGNGKWIGITMYYCPKCFSIYHFVPLMFVLGIIISTILAIFKMPIFIVLMGILYGIFNILNIVSVSIKNKFHIEYLILPFIIFSFHIAYGIGTIIGFLHIPPHKKNKR